VKPAKTTDDIQYNWTLSSERAIAVVNVLLTDTEIATQITSIKDSYRKYNHRPELRGATPLNIPPNRVSAIGRGEFEPLGSEPGETWDLRKNRIYTSWDDEAAMARNRRIELIVRLVPQ
jgi:flagellar motor protein MotB